MYSRIIPLKNKVIKRSYSGVWAFTAHTADSGASTRIAPLTSAGPLAAGGTSRRLAVPIDRYQSYEQLQHGYTSEDTKHDY